MNKLKISAVIGGFVTISGIVMFASFYFSNKQLASHDTLNKNVPGASTDCAVYGTTHNIIIKDDKMLPEHIDASQCDVLVITNMDDKPRLVAFGHHDKHIMYDGVEEKNLKKDENLTVTLNQTGTFTVHDHLHDEVEGDFTVAK